MNAKKRSRNRNESITYDGGKKTRHMYYWESVTHRDSSRRDRVRKKSDPKKCTSIQLTVFFFSYFASLSLRLTLQNRKKNNAGIHYGINMQKSSSLWLNDTWIFAYTAMPSKRWQPSNLVANVYTIHTSASSFGGINTETHTHTRF